MNRNACPLRRPRNEPIRTSTLGQASSVKRGIDLEPLAIRPYRRHGKGRAVKSIAVFSNKDSVGKTSFVYHLAWMYVKPECESFDGSRKPRNPKAIALSDYRCLVPAMPGWRYADGPTRRRERR